jgi:hypothetical protein
MLNADAIVLPATTTGSRPSLPFGYSVRSSLTLPMAAD